MDLLKTIYKIINKEKIIFSPSLVPITRHNLFFFEPVYLHCHSTNKLLLIHADATFFFCHSLLLKAPEFTRILRLACARSRRTSAVSLGRIRLIGRAFLLLSIRSGYRKVTGRRRLKMVDLGLIMSSR